MLRIEVGEANLTVAFRSIELQRFLAWDGKTPFRGRPADWPCSDARYDLDLPVCAISAERWPVIHFNPRPASAKPAPRKRLLRLLTMAREAQHLLEEHRDWTHEELAKAMDCRPGHFSRLIRLNYLAPDIVTAILDGTQPEQLTPSFLLKAALPMDWSLQRRLLGFAEPRREITPRHLYGRGLWPVQSDSTAG